MIREYLKNNMLLADGAMGTYYAQITGKDAVFPEMANITEPEVIRRIHKEYIQAGAKLITTNTFSANTHTLKRSREEIKEILIKGYEIARQACEGQHIFIAADIGPIPEITDDNKEVDRESIIEEYRFIADTFMTIGADLFVFETFSSVDYLDEMTAYIKDKNKNAFIMAQFVIMADGYTRKGKSAARIVEEVKKIKHIDAYGFNCGTGPTPLFGNIKKIDFSGDIVSVMPNAGFPEIINERMVYSQNEEYFANVMMEMKRSGVSIIGGCCGTTPVHIGKMAEKIQKQNGKYTLNAPAQVKEVFNKQSEKRYLNNNQFYKKLEQDKFVVAVELDPPSESNIEKILKGAQTLKDNGVDMITVSDSPLGRARVNSMVVAAKIKREIGIDTIPHLCCRDRNIIALKSDLIAAYIEGIRNILLVTGDPIPSAEKNEIKSVFNLNSLKLMKLLSEMNKEQFTEEPCHIGGALNFNVRNKEVEVARMYKKVEAGADFFLTQPIFDQEVIAYIRKLKKPKQVKILGGIMPIVSYRNAQFLNNEIPGIKIPEMYVNRFNEGMTREEAEKAGIEIAVDIANQIKEYVDGFYLITPFNRINLIVEIMKRVT